MILLHLGQMCKKSIPLCLMYSSGICFLLPVFYFCPPLSLPIYMFTRSLSTIHCAELNPLRPCLLLGLLQCIWDSNDHEWYSVFSACDECLWLVYSPCLTCKFLWCNMWQYFSLINFASFMNLNHLSLTCTWFFVMQFHACLCWVIVVWRAPCTGSCTVYEFCVHPVFLDISYQGNGVNGPNG